MTSTPASRSTRATTLAPRSCPSRPGLAITTRMAPMIPPQRHALGTRPHYHPWYGAISNRSVASARDRPGAARAVSELLNRCVTQHQVLDAVLAAEIDLRLGVVAGALQGQHRAQAVGVVRDLVPRRQGGDGPVAGRAEPGPPGQPLGGGRRRRGLVTAPLDEMPGDLVEEARLPVELRPPPPGPRDGSGQVQAPFRPGDPHVSQPAFLLQFLGVV